MTLFLRKKEHAIVTAGVITLLAIMRQNDKTTPHRLTLGLITSRDRFAPAGVERLSYEEKNRVKIPGSDAATNRNHNRASMQSAA